MESAFTGVQTLTIPLSGTVSNHQPINQATMLGLLAPVMTSCQIYMQVSTDTTSANFRRAMMADGGADLVWDVGPGSKAVVLTEDIHPYNYLRLESSVAQAAARSIELIAKVR